MKKILLSLTMIVCFSVSNQVIAQTCNDTPIINSFEPNTGFIGSKVEIFGANFDSNNPDNNIVYFGATKAEVLSATFGKLEVIVPVGASTERISVTNQCDLTAYSPVPFNGIFCPTPITSTTYQNNAQILPVTYGAYNMIAFDMDLDGRPEVLSASNGGGLSVAKNNSTAGNISFSHINMGGRGGQSIYGADFDGDGLKDIVTRFNVWRNTSTGPGNVALSGSAVSTNGISDYQVAAGDFNKDGKIDIIGENGNWLYIARNTSSGPGSISFAGRQAIANTGSNVNGLMVGDIDGDGKTDILCNQRGAHRALFYRNTTPDGSATFSFASPLIMNTGGTGPYRSQIADFNKDGKIDYVTVNFDNPSFNTAVFINTSTPGNVSFNSPINLPSPSCNYRVQVGDVDGDGFPDIVSKSLCNNIFSVYRNTTTDPNNTTFAPRFDYTSSAQGEVSGIVIGDLDGDFVPDIATSGINSNQIRFHRNTSSQEDNTAPTAVCQDITVALDPTGNVTITPDMVDNGSSDACGIESISLSQTTFTCADIGENTVILTVTDNAGNVTTCTATVNVQPAAIIVTGQTTVCQGESIPMTANDGDSYQWQKDGVDIAGATSQTYTATETGAYTVTVVNAGGCSGTSLPTNVTVNNNPTVEVFPSGTTYICPPSGTAVLTASQSAIYQWMKDGVDIPNATQQSYTATSVGNYSVRVIDLFGCSAESDQITVAANPPEIDVAEGATPIATGSLSDYGDVFPNVNNVKTFTINNTGANALDISDILVNGADAQYFSIVGAPSSVAANSSATFDLVFNAPNITTYSASVTIVSNDCDEGNITFDVIAEITCVGAELTNVPGNLGVNTDEGVCGAVVNYGVGTNGNPTPSITYAFSGATTASGSGTGAGTLFNVGTTVVTLTASNACGTDTQSFSVTVTDNEAPVIQGQNLNLTMDFNAGVGSPPSYTEDGITFLSLYGTSSHVHLGDNDGDGSNDILNHAGCCSTPYRLTVGAGTQYTLISMNVKRVSGNPTFSVYPTGASVTITSPGIFTFPAGFEDVTEVRWHQGSGTMAIDDLVVSTETTGSCPEDINVNTDPGECGAIVNFSAEAVDNCSAAVTFSHAPGSFFPVGTTVVTTTATDPSGNTSTCTFNVTVNDNEAPNVMSQNVIVELDATGNASITPQDVDNGSNDACGIQSISLSKTDFDCSNVGANTVTLTVVDNNGNANTGTATVTVNDVTAPNAVAQDISINLDASGNASITAAQINNGSSDACGIASLSVSQTNFTCDNVGSNPVTLTVIDNNGNESTATATVTVYDVTAPNVSTQNVTIELDENGQASINTGDIDNGSSDACGVASLSLSQTAFDCSHVGTNTVTLTVTDVNGNVNTGTATVTVEDNIAPEVIAPAAITVLNDAGVCGAVINIGTPDTSDNCEVESVENDGLAFYPVGTTTVTWTVTDVNGNVSTATQEITVTNDDPIINGFTMPESILIGTEGSYSAAYTDNNVVSATWDWGDGSSSAGTVDGQTINGTHTYAATGLYRVNLTITDACGETATQEHAFIPVFDPGEGHITGGGHLTTSTGDLKTNASASGKSNYGFQGKYLPNGRLQGTMNFHVNGAGFKFKSEDAQWMVVFDDNAIMKGTGRVNDVLGYEYTATMVDVHVNGRSGNDRFRIQVRETSTGNIIYDNETGVELDVETQKQIDKGTVVIHRGGSALTADAATSTDGGSNGESGGKGKGKGKNKLEVFFDAPVLEVQANPNPTADKATIIFSSNVAGPASVGVFNTNGLRIANLFEGNIEADKNVRIEFDGTSVNSGLYLVRVNTAGTIRTVKLLIRK